VVVTRDPDASIGDNVLSLADGRVIDAMAEPGADRVPGDLPRFGRRPC
jgi:hypothetical protein